MGRMRVRGSKEGFYTAQTGLPYFDRAAVTANGNW